MMDNRFVPAPVQPMIPIPTGHAPSETGIDGIRCVLFDIYGTLFISASGDIGTGVTGASISEPLARLLEKYNRPMEPEHLQNALRAAVRANHMKSQKQGIDFPEVRIEQIWMQLLDIRDPDRVKHFAMEYEWLVNPVYPMPGLAKMLMALKQMPVCVGIISNAQFYTPSLFEWFLGTSMAQLGFEKGLTFFSCDLGCAKPSQTIFKRAVNALEGRKITPGETLYVGNDMLNDIYPASVCGMKTALFAGDARSLRLREDHLECRGLWADLVVTDLRQIPHLLAKGQQDNQRSKNDIGKIP